MSMLGICSKDGVSVSAESVEDLVGMVGVLCASMSARRSCAKSVMSTILCSNSAAEGALSAFIVANSSINLHGLGNSASDPSAALVAARRKADISKYL